MAESGYEVTATARHPERLAGLPARALALDIDQPESADQLQSFVNRDTLVLDSIPMVTEGIVQAVKPARRVVYLSTTGVYGDQQVIDETTKPAPLTERERLRANADAAMFALPQALVLRPAAIYGPFRGIHAGMRAGSYRLPVDGSRYISRIHVDDLAAHCVAALQSEITGAAPVADEDPCTSDEIAAFCAQLLGMPLPARVENTELSETRRGNRKVDGSAIRKKLGIELKYPSYRVGIPACLAAEAVEREP